MTGEIQKLKENTDTQSTANNERLRQVRKSSCIEIRIQHVHVFGTVYMYMCTFRYPKDF